MAKRKLMTVRIEPDDRGISRRIARSARTLDRNARNVMESFADLAKEEFSAAAPGSVSRGVEVDVLGSQIFISVHRYSEEGYDYAPVTRFGHRVERIYPVHKQALKTPWGPRAWVRGYKPDHDWADDAIPVIREAIGPHVREIGRRWAVQLRVAG